MVFLREGRNSVGNSGFEASDRDPGAGGIGTAGYWGYSDGEKHSEENFEKHYIYRIPRGRYPILTHVPYTDPITCATCKTPNKIHFCAKRGFAFEGFLTTQRIEKQWLVTVCECGEILRKVRASKRLNKRVSR